MAMGVGAIIGTGILTLIGVGADRAGPAVLLSFAPEVLRYTVEPVQRAIFGRAIVEPEVIRMLLFGFALVLMMLFRPAGILPSATRKRELEAPRTGAAV